MEGGNLSKVLEVITTSLVDYKENIKPGKFEIHGYNINTFNDDKSYLLQIEIEKKKERKKWRKLYREKKK